MTHAGAATIPEPEHGSCVVAGPGLDRALAVVHRRSVRATLGVAVFAAGSAVALATFDLRLALLAVAFILGWLNLAGL